MGISHFCSLCSQCSIELSEQSDYLNLSKSCGIICLEVKYDLSCSHRSVCSIGLTEQISSRSWEKKNKHLSDPKEDRVCSFTTLYIRTK